MRWREANILKSRLVVVVVVVVVVVAFCFFVVFSTLIYLNTNYFLLHSSTSKAISYPCDGRFL
jgi:hypothetical protein